MGQYYKIINLDTKEAIDPGELKHFRKLMEFAYGESRVEKFIFSALSDIWKNHRVVLAGDYYYEEDKTCLYDMEEYTEPRTKELIEKINNGSQTKLPQFFCNADKKEYVQIKNRKDKVSPIILLALGNGLGLGDYEGTNMKLVGSWAYNRVFTTDQLPEGYKLIKATFSIRR